jgi:ribosomal protein L22
MSILAPGVLASQRQTEMNSRLESAVSSAVSEAKKCNVDIDNVEMSISIVDTTYKIEMFNPRARGGGVVLVVERATAKVKSCTCLQ